MSTLPNQTKPMTIPVTVKNAVRALSEAIGDANAAKGFHHEGEDLELRVRRARRDLNVGDPELVAAEANLRRYWEERINLIGTEVAEAFEELRKGNTVTQTYYSIQRPGKPEGFPSEHADILIRTLDLAAQIQRLYPDYDLMSMVEEKLWYNTTRPYKHGKVA